MNGLGALEERFMNLVRLGRPAIPKEVEEDEPDQVAEDTNVHLRDIMTDPDMSGALIGLIDKMTAESNAFMSAGRHDHTDMLFHHGAYVRLTELKMELARLAGLT